MKLFPKSITAAVITATIGAASLQAVDNGSVLKSQSDSFGQEMPNATTKAKVKESFHSAVGSMKIAKRASKDESNLNESGIFAYLGGGNYSKTMGMYRLFLDGGYEYMWSESLLDNSFVMQTGWLRDGSLCGFAQFGVGTWILGYAYEEVNLATGETVSEPKLINLDDNYLGYYQIAAYNPNNDRIYGYGYVESAGDRSVFKSSPASEPENGTIVKQDYVAEEACLALCYNDEKGTLAGINLNHEFVYIDLEGNQTPVMELGIEGLQNIVSAMTWSASEGYYLFNAIIADGVSELYAIDPEEESVTLLSPMSDGLTFAFMVTDENIANPEAPMMPTITRLTFDDGESDGMLGFSLPTTNGKGDQLDTQLEFHVWVDGNIWEHSSEYAGETVYTSFRNLTEGEHVFRVGASLNGNMSPKATIRKYIGNDTPKSPSNVIMRLNKVTWDAVTGGVHNGYVNIDELEYEVYLNEEWYGSTTENSMEIELPEGEITPYTCHVYAVCAGKESASSASNTIVFGDPFELDVEIEPTEEQAMLVTVLDANSDESTWHPRNYMGSIVFSYYTDAVNTGDDWLFLPGINFDNAESIYSLNFDNCYYSTKTNEFFEVWLCVAPDIESERHCILGKTQPASNKFEETDINFSIPSEGTWYVAFRAVSDPAQSYLNIRNIRIAKTDASLKGPGTVTETEFKDATEGDKFMSEVTFKMPETLFDGTPISPSTEITAYVKGESEATVTANPGSLAKAVVEVAEGFSLVSVKTYADGNMGAETFIKVYAGPDVPGDVNNLNATVADDNRSVTITWEAPTEGLNGGSISQEGLKYMLMIFNGKVWTYSSAEINGTTCVYTPDDTETLKNYTFSIEASNDKGYNDNANATVSAQLGTPLLLPIIEDFPESQISITPLDGYTFGRYTSTEWGMADPTIFNSSFNLDGRAVMTGSASIDEAKGCLVFPKFSTENITDYPAVKMLLWTGNNAASMSVYAFASGDAEPVKVYDIPAGTGWEFVEFTLPESMSGRPWVQIMLEANYASTAEHALLGEYMFFTTKLNGIEDTEIGSFIVNAGDNAINIIAENGKKVDIWSLDGKSVASFISTGEKTSIATARGIYIVRIDGEAVKVNVK